MSWLLGILRTAFAFYVMPFVAIAIALGGYVLAGSIGAVVGGVVGFGSYVAVWTWVWHRDERDLAAGYKAWLVTLREAHPNKMTIAIAEGDWYLWAYLQGVITLEPGSNGGLPPKELLVAAGGLALLKPEFAEAMAPDPEIVAHQWHEWSHGTKFVLTDKAPADVPDPFTHPVIRRLVQKHRAHAIHLAHGAHGAMH